MPDYPKAIEDKLSVAAWVTVEKWTDRLPKIASNWGNSHDNQTGQFNFGLYNRDGDLAVRVIQRDGTRLTLREGSDSPVPFSKWQHVVFVLDGNMLRLYRNGKEVASTKCDGLRPDPPVSLLAIGCKNDDPNDISYAWRGLIDELAVFNSALSPETVRRLHEAKPLPSAKTTNQERR